MYSEAATSEEPPEMAAEAYDEFREYYGLLPYLPCHLGCECNNSIKTFLKKYDNIVGKKKKVQQVLSNRILVKGFLTTYNENDCKKLFSRLIYNVKARKADEGEDMGYVTYNDIIHFKFVQEKHAAVVTFRNRYIRNLVLKYKHEFMSIPFEVFGFHDKENKCIKELGEVLVNENQYKLQSYRDNGHTTWVYRGKVRKNE